MGNSNSPSQLVPSAQPQQRKNQAGDLCYCDEHDVQVWFYAWNDCPACDERDENKRTLRELRTKNTLLRKELKLAKLELKEERALHAGTKLKAAPYLTRMKEIETEVEAHELLR